MNKILLIALALLLSTSVSTAEYLLASSRGLERVYGEDFERETLVEGNFTGLSLSATSLVYLASSDNSIHVYDRINGTSKTLISDLQNTPYDLTTVSDQYLIWTEPNAQRIMRSNLSGGNVEVIISGQSLPRGIIYDEESEKIYWVDGATLKRANVDGSDPETLYTESTPLGGFYNLALYGRYVYLVESDGINGAIRVFDLQSTGYASLYATYIDYDARFQGIAIDESNTTLHFVSSAGTLGLGTLASSGGSPTPLSSVQAFDLALGDFSAYSKEYAQGNLPENRPEEREPQKLPANPRSLHSIFYIEYNNVRKKTALKSISFYGTKSQVLGEEYTTSLQDYSYDIENNRIYYLDYVSDEGTYLRSIAPDGSSMRAHALYEEKWTQLQYDNESQSLYLFSTNQIAWAQATEPTTLFFIHTYEGVTIAGSVAELTDGIRYRLSSGQIDEVSREGAAANVRMILEADSRRSAMITLGADNPPVYFYCRYVDDYFCGVNGGLLRYLFFFTIHSKEINAAARVTVPISHKGEELEHGLVLFSDQMLLFVGDLAIDDVFQTKALRLLYVPFSSTLRRLKALPFPETVKGIPQDPSGTEITGKFAWLQDSETESATEQASLRNIAVTLAPVEVPASRSDNTESTDFRVTTTDSEGSFTFRNITPGQYTLRYRRNDLDFNENEIRITSGETMYPALVTPATALDNSCTTGRPSKQFIKANKKSEKLYTMAIASFEKLSEKKKALSKIVALKTALIEAREAFLTQAENVPQVAISCEESSTCEEVDHSETVRDFFKKTKALSKAALALLKKTSGKKKFSKQKSRAKKLARTAKKSSRRSLKVTYQCQQTL